MSKQKGLRTAQFHYMDFLDNKNNCDFEIQNKHENDIQKEDLFPFGEKLKKLYDALLQASSFANDNSYRGFNENDTSNSDKYICKARIVFSEFDIIEYGVNLSKMTKFNPPLNSLEHLEDNLEQIKRFLQLLYNKNFKYTSTCPCGTPIHHMFTIRNRVTLKQVSPIGRICIMKFSDTDTARIMTEVSKTIEKYYVTEEKDEKRKMKEELKLMRLEDKVDKVKVKKAKTQQCAYDCPCFQLRELNKKQSDPLLFDMNRTNSKPYIDVRLEIRHKYV